MKKVLDLLKLHKEYTYRGNNCNFFEERNHTKYNVQPGSVTCIEKCKHFMRDNDIVIYCDLKK